MRIARRHFALLVLSATVWPNHAWPQDVIALPGSGQVHTQPKRGVMLRSAPPTVTPFGYELGPAVCGLPNGTQIVAVQDLFVANGEKWLRVEVSNEVDSTTASDCPTAPFSGWVIGRLKTGVETVVLGRTALLSSPTIQEPEVEEEATEQEGKNPFAEIGLLFVGTFFAASVFTLERDRRFHARFLRSSFFWFEVGVLAIINGVFAMLVAEKLVSPTETDPFFRLLSFLREDAAGYAILGFLLSLVLLKFISFATPQPE